MRSNNCQGSRMQFPKSKSQAIFKLQTTTLRRQRDPIIPFHRPLTGWNWFLTLICYLAVGIWYLFVTWRLALDTSSSLVLEISLEFGSWNFGCPNLVYIYKCPSLRQNRSGGLPFRTSRRTLNCCLHDHCVVRVPGRHNVIDGRSPMSLIARGKTGNEERRVRVPLYVFHGRRT